MKKLGDLLTAQPKSKIKAGEGLTSGEYKFFNSSNIQTKYYHTAQFHDTALIFGTGGNPSIHYCDEPFSTSTDCIVYFPKRSDFSVKMVYHYLSGHMEILENGFKGAGIRHISKGYLEEIEIPFLPMEEQEKIVSVFDRLDFMLDSYQRMSEKLDLLVKSRFIEMFGDVKLNSKHYEIISLEKIANVGSSKRVFVEELQESGIPFYRGTEIGELAEGKNIVPELFITQEHYEILKKATGIPSIGDLLMPSICSDGRIWAVNTKEPFYFKDGRVLWIHPNFESINSLYLLYFLKQKIAIDYDSIASGSTFSELKIFALKELQIFVPPLELQNQFAEFVQFVEKSKQTIKHQIAKTELLKSALMQKYFKEVLSC